jgi:hypothetical protein
MHAFACAAGTFFIPALATGLWLLASKKLLTQFSHGIAVLNVSEISREQTKLFSCVVYQFVICKTARSYSTNGAGF